MYSLTHSLTHSMVQNIFWKADRHSAFQKNPAFFMETEGSLPCSQKPAIGPYPEPSPRHFETLRKNKFFMVQGC
jgi:hypothetical protein